MLSLKLLDLLREQALLRAKLEPDATLSVETVFYLVRDMPYRRTSDHQPATVIYEWRGTCSSKHLLLKALFAELGRRSTLMACTQHLAPGPALKRFPELESLFAQGVVPDVHNYLVLATDPGSMQVDATWPISAETLGLPVNKEFNWGRDMRLAGEMLSCEVVPEKAVLSEFKRDMLARHFSPAEIARRDAFFTHIAS